MRADTTPAGARDLLAIWDDTRSRIVELLSASTDDVVDTAVPTVPGTTVHDVLAHLVGVATRATKAPREARLDTVALPAAGGATRGGTAQDLLLAWQHAATAAAAHLATDPDLASLLITDAVMSEHDLRTAIDTPGARDSDAIRVALDELSGRFSDRVARAGLPPLRVTVEQWGTIAGAGHAISCVVADRFEFVRAMSGRRSAGEIGRWNWGVDPGVYLPVISEVGVPAEEIHERDPRIPQHMRDREFVL
ncbi:maleylpyruvate isomerase N-terminal domain-containing protein [[Mycobacterium] vasticus]|uniref:Maleylpyruvate isomerase N-terminal domain-containing protein n=1 Tax=[Mycobacterium] vasticus TaxID=2875777 RepID=A0ABU5Z1Z8_9MYCO|nr:maleylpyruvate isomerase N-terminal domain-containing protein [Mycolicibacter sp. MYC017]MEB3070649.1 maleylpyruvate isomerase N-terminal domain-containing protein [Mycolicibacter sp. MYC017]